MGKRAMGGIIFLIGLLAVFPSVEKRLKITASSPRFLTQSTFDPSPTLEWEIFFGSFPGGYSGGSDIIKIVLDGKGNIYLAGTSYSSWGFPLLPHNGGSDAFVARFDAFGRMIWNTFLGTSGWDQGQGIAVDGNGFIYVTGNSDSSWGSPIRPFTPGSSDVFVMKLDGAGNLIWNTFLGSAGYDGGCGIAVDINGVVSVTGISTSSWGYPKNPHTDAVGGPNADTFISRIDVDGQLRWNTFCGSVYSDYGNDIAADYNGNLYVAGSSEASWGVPIDPFDVDRYNGFLASFDNQGQLIWNTFSWDKGGWASGIALDNGGAIFTTFMGGGDGAVAKYGINGERTWFIPINSFFPLQYYIVSMLFFPNIALDCCHNAYVPFWYSYCTEPCGDPPRTKIFAGAAKINRDGVWLWHTPYNSFEWTKVFSEATGIAADCRNIYVTGHRGSSSFLAKLKQPNPPPGVRIVRPQDKAVLHGEVEILAEAIDDLGVNRVEFTVDEILKKKAIWPPPFACTWDTRGQFNGTHVIRARAYDDEGASADDEITVDVQNLTLTLAAERKEEKAWIIRRQYGKIGLVVSNRVGIPVTRFMLLRKAVDGDFQLLREISPNEISNGQYSYMDKYLEYGKSYTYRVEARLGSGELAAVSNDISI